MAGLPPSSGDPRPEPDISTELPVPADPNDAHAEAGAVTDHVDHVHAIEARWHQPVRAEWHDVDGRPRSLLHLALSIHYAPRAQKAFFKLYLRVDLKDSRHYRIYLHLAPDYVRMLAPNDADAGNTRTRSLRFETTRPAMLVAPRWPCRPKDRRAQTRFALLQSLGRATAFRLVAPIPHRGVTDAALQVLAGTLARRELASDPHEARTEDYYKGADAAVIDLADLTLPPGLLDRVEHAQAIQGPSQQPFMGSGGGVVPPSYSQATAQYSSPDPLRDSPPSPSRKRRRPSPGPVEPPKSRLGTVRPGPPPAFSSHGFEGLLDQAVRELREAQQQMRDEAQLLAEELRADMRQMRQENGELRQENHQLRQGSQELRRVIKKVEGENSELRQAVERVTEENHQLRHAVDQQTASGPVGRLAALEDQVREIWSKSFGVASSVSDILGDDDTTQSEKEEKGESLAAQFAGLRQHVEEEFDELGCRIESTKDDLDALEAWRSEHECDHDEVRDVVNQVLDEDTDRLADDFIRRLVQRLDDRGSTVDG